MAYVYRHIRLDKNVPFYIGVCRKEKDKYHLRAYEKRDRNKTWNQIVSQTEYEVEIIMDNLDVDSAEEKEREFISLYKRIADGGTLVNVTFGGEKSRCGSKCPWVIERNKTGIWKGKKHKKESRQRISLSHKGIPKKEDWKINMSKAKIGMYTGVKNPKYRGEIYAYDLEGNFVKSFELMKDAAEWAGISLASIGRYIEGKRYPSRKGIVYTRKKRH